MLESFLLGLVVLVPLVWALGVLAELHRGALAGTAAAREGGSEAARADGVVDAATAIDSAVREALSDHGLDPSRAEVRWRADPGLPRGGSVQVAVRYPVTVLDAPLIGRVAELSIWIRAVHLARIDSYGSRR